MSGKKTISNSGSAGVSISDQDPPEKRPRKRKNRRSGASVRDDKKRKTRLAAPEKRSWSGGKSKKKDVKAPRRTEHKPKNVGGPNLSAPFTAAVNVGSISAAEHHRALEAERAEVDSQRYFMTCLLQEKLASMISAFSAGFEAGRALVADQATGNVARDWQIEELQKELATARKAAVINNRQIKSDGKQIAELQAQLEESRDAVVLDKLERVRLRQRASKLVDYIVLAGEMMESIEKAGQWRKHFANFEPDLRARFVKLYEHCMDDCFWYF